MDIVRRFYEDFVESGRVDEIGSIPSWSHGTSTFGNFVTTNRSGGCCFWASTTEVDIAVRWLKEHFSLDDAEIVLTGDEHRISVYVCVPRHVDWIDSLKASMLEMRYFIGFACTVDKCVVYRFDPIDENGRGIGATMPISVENFNFGGQDNDNRQEIYHGPSVF